MKLKYGVNPHQSARILTPPSRLPFEIVNGDLSYINVLDALNSWQLIMEAHAALGTPVAASFKHVSPAGVATAGPLDATDVSTSGITGASGITAAYVRARNCDPRSSFGDFVAVSDRVDAELAEFLSHTVSDGIIAPAYDAGAVAVLKRKKRRTYLILEGKKDFSAPLAERRDVFGVTVEQERDSTPISANVLRNSLPQGAIHDALLSMVTVKYTQSNSVAFVRGGRTLGVGAGQQSRVDCTRLAASKVSTWWARRHEFVEGLLHPAGMTRQDRLNWQMRLVENDMTTYETNTFRSLFDVNPDEFSAQERRAWSGMLTGSTMASDGFLPFRDNVDHAGRIGTVRIVEPGGSIRSDSVADACAELGIDLVRTGVRLFHH